MSKSMAEEYGPQTEAALRTFADVKHGFEVNKSREYLLHLSYMIRRFAAIIVILYAKTIN
jgi:hypothetical protein